MVTVNAGTGWSAEGVFESELAFGHRRQRRFHRREDGSRRALRAAADGECLTLFLDEIANVPLNLQAKLLRVLEIGEMERVGSSKTKRVDVRVISATNAVLGEEVAHRGDITVRICCLSGVRPQSRFTCRA